jgi:hypothetical protein
MLSLNTQNESKFPRYNNALVTPTLDILSLLNLEQPLAQCQKCLAILPKLARNHKQQIYCSHCGVEYIVNSKFPIEVVRSHFRKQRLYINDIDDIFEHCKRLASIAHRIQQNTPDYPPIRGLLEAYKQAKRFIHVNSWGISREFLMTLKLVAQDIPVRGIISLSPDQNWLLDELHNYKNEAPNLQIKTICASSDNWDNLPHQKLIVIDGLLAFKGSANLTLAAWRKAQWNYDEVEVVTDVAKVINLHNRYFSSVWAKLSDYGEAIAIANYLIDDIAA